jgi:glycosyltransferase involved in cell wall biosynthesis
MADDRVFVSVVIPLYNEAENVHDLHRELTASLERLGRTFEILLVDDGSRDNSASIIKDFGDEIVPIFHPKNLGLPSARNTGIRRAQGRFVVYLDSDDYLHEELVYHEYVHLAMNAEWGAAGIIAALRQDRTHLPPPDQCPLCPGPTGLTTEIGGERGRHRPKAGDQSRNGSERAHGHISNSP